MVSLLSWLFFFPSGLQSNKNTPAWRAKGIERTDVDQSCHSLFLGILTVPRDSCGRNLVPRHFRLLSLRAADTNTP